MYQKRWEIPCSFLCERFFRSRPYLFSHPGMEGRSGGVLFTKINTFQFMRKEGHRHGSFPYRKDQRLYGHVKPPSAGYVAVPESKGAFLSLMLSLPEEWDYTMKGLARICKDGGGQYQPAVSGSWRARGYLIRERVRGANGQLGSIEYTILEQPKEPAPVQGKPIRENPVQANPTLDVPAQEEPAQLNKEESSKEKSKKDLSITEISNPIRIKSPAPYGAVPGRDRDGNGWDESQRGLS